MSEGKGQLERRRAVMSGGSTGKGARFLGGVAMVLLLGAGAFVILAPLRGEHEDTAGTSQSAAMQDRGSSAGVETRMPVTAPDEEAQATLLKMEPPVVPAVMSSNGSDSAERIARLERELEALRAERDDVDLEALLEKQRMALEAQFERQLAQLRQTIPADGGYIGGLNEAERDARRRLAEERARRAAIRERQILSDGIVLDASGAVTASTSPTEGGAPGRRLTANEAFIQEASARTFDTVRATRIAAPDRTIVQGTTVSAVLETAISSELPGVIRATVTDDVLSYDGENVLLEQGTRLIGSYNSDVSVVQGRVQIAWNRAVTPEGVSVELGGYGSDALGVAGQAGEVDSRFRERFGSAALISLISAGPEIIVGRDADVTQQNTVGDLSADVQTAAQGVMGEYLAAGPVIYIEQGTEMTVFVNRDLVF